jgi:photosynthetic reaction center cytochrome c subunit
MIRVFAAVAAAFVGVLFLAYMLTDSTDAVQRGFRGTGLAIMYKPDAVEALRPLNAIPEPEDPADPPIIGQPTITERYKNIQVLKDLSVNELSRVMAAFVTWVAPEEGCVYCHNTQNMASDEKYTKVVARRMLQMTRTINNEWTQHVGSTGVTCWTCHRGQAVPSGDWFARPQQQVRMLGNRDGQDQAGVATVGNSSLPNDPLTTFLTRPDDNIRVQGTRPLAGANPTSVKRAEHTYGLMIYMSKSLGVNCDYCHNTRALARWEQSSPQRITAWYGIRMVRSLNINYLVPLKGLFPEYRLSPEGDGPKVACATCHKGSYKPLYGETMKGDWPEFWRRGGVDTSNEVRTLPVNHPLADPALVKVGLPEGETGYAPEPVPPEDEE